MRYLKRYSTDADYNSDKNNLQWPTVCGIDDGEQSRFIEDVEELGATVTMYPNKKAYTIEDTTIQSTIIVAHNLTEPCDIELSCEDSNVTINQDTFTNVIGAVSTYMTYPLTTQDGVNGSKTFEVTAEISSSDQTIEEDAELVVNNILPRVIPITITSGSDSKLYDGIEFSDNTYSITSGSLLSGHHISDVTISGRITNAGSVTNTISNAVILDSSNANVTNYYDITYVPGTLTVTKRNVVMTSASDSKVYDAVTFSNEDVTVTGSGFAQGEGATYSNFGHQLLVGTIDNTFDYTLNQGTLADNYTITKVYGTLEVTDGTGVGEDPVSDDLVITVTAESPSNGYGYGDEVEFQVTVTNIYDSVKSIYLSTIDGITLAQANFEGVLSGAIVETTATYTIGQGEILSGSFTGSVTAYLGGNNVSPLNCSLSATNSATVLTESPNGNLSIFGETTSITPDEGYALGDTIQYEVYVVNDGNLRITNITLTCEASGSVWIIPSLNPDEESDHFEDTYSVTEDDVLAEEVVVVYNAQGTSPDPDEPNVPVEPLEIPEPVESPNG